MQENKWENYFFSDKTNNKVAMEKIEDILVYSIPYVSLNTVPLRFIVKIVVKMWDSSKHFGTKIFKVYVN